MVNKDLKSDGFAGEIHVNAGATLRLTVSGSLGDTAHGTFVADGATLETLASGGASSLDFVLYASWDTPPQIEEGNTEGGGLASRHVPIVQLVYNGIWLQNPFTLTVNAVLRDRYRLLKLLEYGGRTTFYFHSKFITGAKNWTAQGDLSCATDDDLAVSAARIKEECDIWRPFARHPRLGGCRRSRALSPCMDSEAAVTMSGHTDSGASGKTAGGAKAK